MPPSQYTAYQSPTVRQDGHERGAAILVNNQIFHQRIQLNTNLQAVAIKISLDKLYNICSLYLPHVEVAMQEIQSLIDQLPPPILILTIWTPEAPYGKIIILQEPIAKVVFLHICNTITFKFWMTAARLTITFKTTRIQLLICTSVSLMYYWRWIILFWAPLLDLIIS